MIIKSGIVTTGAVNQVDSLFSSNLSQEEIEARQRLAAQKEAERQAQMKAMMDSLNSSNQSEKKWSVPFK